LSVAVTPVGRFVTAIATSPVKFVRVIVSGTVVDAPTTADAVAEPLASVIEATGTVTASVTVVVAEVTPLPAAVMVIVLLDAAAVAPAVSVRVDAVVPFGSVEGAKDATTSAGMPLALSVTTPV
jgi:hypothetical protein